MKTTIKIIFLFELFLIICLIIYCIKLHRDIMKAKIQYADSLSISCLHNAVKCKAPLIEFKYLVENHPKHINYPKNNDLSNYPSILSVCAEKNLTNHIKILLENGADIQKAINWHTKYGKQNAINILNKYSNK